MSTTALPAEWDVAIGTAATAIARKEDLEERDVVTDVKLRVHKGQAQVRVRAEKWESFGRTRGGMREEAIRLLASGRLCIETPRVRRTAVETRRGAPDTVVLDDDGEVEEVAGEEEEEEDGEGEGDEGAAKEAAVAQETPRLYARDAVLVAIVRDHLTVRGEIQAVATAFSNNAGVSKALCPAACDPDRDGHALWTIEDGVYNVTTDGVSRYATLLDAHPSLDPLAGAVPAAAVGGEVAHAEEDDGDADVRGRGGGGQCAFCHRVCANGGSLTRHQRACASNPANTPTAASNAPVPAPVAAAPAPACTMLALMPPPSAPPAFAAEGDGRPAEAAEAHAATETVESMLTASDAATDALNCELSYVSGTKLRSDAVNDRFGELFKPGDRMTDVLETVEGELAGIDFAALSTEKSAGLVAAADRQRVAKRAFEAAVAELVAATEATDHVVVEAKRRRGASPTG